LIDQIKPIKVEFPCEIEMVVSDSDFAEQLERNGMRRTGEFTLFKIGQSFHDIP